MTRYPPAVQIDVSAGNAASLSFVGAAAVQHHTAFLPLAQSRSLW